MSYVTDLAYFLSILNQHCLVMYIYVYIEPSNYSTGWHTKKNATEEIINLTRLGFERRTSE